MYRMLIIDDEPFIVDGLVDLFTKSALDLEIFGAYTVTEALDYVQQMKIDLVISDMKMPRKSGLQFVDELLTFWPQCRIIFLSGYDEFDYIYEAMKRNVDGYILKTEDDAILIKTVQDSLEKIEEKKLHEDEISSIEQKMQQMIPALKRELLRDLASGEKRETLLNDTVVDREHFHINLMKQWIVIIGEMDHFTGSQSTQLRKKYYLKNVAEKQLHPHVAMEFFTFKDEFLVWMIQPKESEGFFYMDGVTQWKALHKYLKGFMEELQTLSRQMIQTNISLIIAPQPVDADTFHPMLHQMIHSLKMISYFKAGDMIIDLAKEPLLWEESPEVQERPVWRQDLLKIEKKIMQGDLPEAEKGLEKLYQELYSQTSTSLQKTEFVYSLTLLLLKFLRNEELQEHLKAQDQEMFERLIEDFPIMIHSRENLLYMMREICRFQLKKREEGHYNIEVFVNKYIEENISNDLSLTKIAEVVYLNPTYLSRVYKEITGRNITDYIDHVKIERAKNYLQETDLYIQEIAKYLGFNSSSYFTAFFKKYVSVSPQEYRNQQWKV